MTDEAEAVVTAPGETSAPEAKDETAKAVVADTEQNGEDKAKASSEAADEEEVDSADPETDEEGKSEKPKKPTRTSQLRAKVRGLTVEVEDLQRRLSEREADDSRKPPKEEDFNGDYEAFNRARIAFDTAELLRNERSADTKREIEARQREIRRERLIDHDERVSEARKAIPDYDAVIETGFKSVSGGNPKNLDLLLESEKSELIAYHLAEKPERAREFAHMHPLEAAKHIGKLEARLSLPKPKTKSEAPAPIAPLKGGASPTPDPAKMSMAEYAEWRNKEMRKVS